MEARIQELLDQLTLEEKISLTIGRNNWQTNSVERLGIPSITVNDGPSGLRKPAMGNLMETGALPATCFPAAQALASSWDIALVREVGEALAEECLANDVQVLLGPGVNMKRTPLCGRNFEYYAEDPVLAGEMGCAYVQGVQSKGVGTSLKHFACNNQEYERMTINAQVDQRTLREIYLAAFERVVSKAKPWTVMASYNKLNGIYAAEHPELLNQILKTEWGYEGVVVSDWGAVSEKAQALAAGLDLEMPGHTGNHTEKIAQFVKDGSLSQAAIDEAAARVLRLVFQGREGRQPDARFDKETHHHLVRRAAAESIVLLKNEQNILPLQLETLSSLALIGRFARDSHFQGAGSARVNPLQVEHISTELGSLLPDTLSLNYADGYAEDGSENETLLQEAKEVAQAASVAIVCVGLTDKDEVEGRDREHLDLAQGHNRLVAEVCRVQPNTIVVLCNGSAVTMPWLHEAKTVLEAGLGGQALGGAIADVLVGRVNPSGKLAETFPLRLEDTPAYLNYPGEAGQVRYGEGLFIGYRYYDKKKIQPLFPFGYGLSYTTFEYRDIKLSQATLTDEETLEVTVTVRNSGTRAGKEVIQLYVRDPEASVVRPEKELKAFSKVMLQPGEEKEVSLSLEPRDFAFYDSKLERWSVETGTFELLIGRSSAEIVLSSQITLHAQPQKPVFTRWHQIRSFLAYPQAFEILMEAFARQTDRQMATPADLTMMLGLPLTKLATFNIFSEEQIDALIEQINQAVSVS